MLIVIKSSLERFFTNKIRYTNKSNEVGSGKLMVCFLTNKVRNCVGSENPKVYITARVLKHLYDKKPAEEVDFVLKNLKSTLKLPDRIYRNKEGKRGNFLLSKAIEDQVLLCSIEILENGAHVVTSFKLRKESYLKGFEQVWSWKGDEPSS